MNFSFEERLGWIDPNHYEYGNSVKVIEKESAGNAEIIISSLNKLMRINISHKNKLNYLKKRKVADSVVCKFLGDELELHIIECKRTVALSSWSDVKEQFEGALLHSFALCGILGKNISNVIFYTAFSREKFDYINTADPVFLKNTIGTKEKTSAIDWGSDKINILDRKFKHTKIQLNNDYKGELTL